MFKRDIPTYHDLQKYDDRYIPEDLDELGKKLLYPAYTFDLVMKCREDDKPSLSHSNRLLSIHYNPDPNLNEVI